MATVYQTFQMEHGKFQSSGNASLYGVDGSNYPVMGLAFDAGTDEETFLDLIAINFGSGNHRYGLEIRTRDLKRVVDFWVVDVAKEAS